MKRKLTSFLLTQRIRLLHWLLQDELRRQGWMPEPDTAGRRWEKVETYEMARGKTGSFTNNMAFHEAASKMLKELPR